MTKDNEKQTKKLSPKIWDKQSKTMLMYDDVSQDIKACLTIDNCQERYELLFYTGKDAYKFHPNTVDINDAKKYPVYTGDILYVRYSAWNHKIKDIRLKYLHSIGVVESFRGIDYWIPKRGSIFSLDELFEIDTAIALIGNKYQDEIYYKRFVSLKGASTTREQDLPLEITEDELSKEYCTLSRVFYTFGIDYITGEYLGFCGCGNPNETALYVRDMLRKIDNTYFAGKDLSPEELFFLYWADDKGFTEHGSYIGISCLSGKGQSLLNILSSDTINQLIEEGEF